MKRSRLKCFFCLVLLPSFLFGQVVLRNLDDQPWRFRKKDDKEWLPANVPGTVHTDLLNNKIIPDPYISTNEKKLQWIENEDWEYSTILKISTVESKQEHIELQFDGIDTYADVFLNDVKILSADNMFRT